MSSRQLQQQVLRLDMKHITSSLKKIKKQIKHKRHWTKDTPARRKDGAPIGCNHADAYSFCLYGALRKQEISDAEHDTIYNFILKRIRFRYGKNIGTLSEFNDSKHTKHKDVIDILDTCISDAKKEKYMIDPFSDWGKP